MIGKKHCIIGFISLLLFFSQDITAQKLLIDGIDTQTISGETCGKKHTLKCDLPQTFPNTNYCMWQRSDDDGATWNNMPQSGQDVYSIEVSNDNGGKQLYHVIIAPTLGDALNPSNGGAVNQTSDISLECDLSICGEKENRLVVWKEDFKSTPPGERRECADVQNRRFAGQYNLEYATNINNSMYAIVSHSKDGSTPQYNWFSGGTDHTGNKDGGFLLINNPDGIGSEHMLIFEKAIDFDLCPDTWYYFSMYAMCVTGGFARNPNSKGAYPNFMFEIIGEDGVTVLESGLSGEVPVAAYGISTWINYGISFNAGNNKNVLLRIYDDAVKDTPGNDMAIDDISLIACQKEVPATNLSAGLSPDMEGICGSTATLTLSAMSDWEKSYPTVYVVWQKSLDGGYIWNDISEVCGEKSYTIQVPFEKSDNGIRYRAVIAKDETTAKFIAKNGYSNDACSIYMITNVSTLTCHCATPEISLTPTDTFFCLIQDDSITLSASVTNDVNVDEYHWLYKTDANGTWSPITTENGTHMKVSPTEQTYYAVYAVNDKCISDTDSCVVRVIIPDKISIPLEGQDSVCKNSSVLLKMNTSTSAKVSWWGKKKSDTSYSLLTTSEGPSIELSPKNGDSYYAISEVDPQTCKAFVSDTFTFYVEDPILIEKNNLSYKICAGKIVNLTAISESPNVIGIRWSKSNAEGVNKIISETNTVKDTPTESCYYIITYMAKTCPSVSDSSWIEVVQKNNLKLTISEETICKNSTVTLNANYGDATGIVWEKMSEGASSYEAFSTDLTPKLDLQPNEKTIYRIRTSDGSVCPIAYSNSVTVVVDDSIKIKAEPSSVEVMAGEPINLNATISGSVVSYEWRKKTGSTEEIRSHNLELSDISDVDCEYIFEAKGNGCPNESLSIPVTILQPLDLSLSISTDTICVGGDAMLTTELSDVSNIVWLYKPDGASVFLEITDFSSSTNKVTPSTTTHYKIKEKGRDNYSNTVTLYVEQPVELDLTGPEMACPGSEVTLEYKVTPLSTILEIDLLESNTNTTTEQTLSSNPVGPVHSQITVTPNLETKYTLKVSTKYCPEMKMSHLVKIIDVPKDFSFETSADTICFGDSVILKTDFPLSKGEAQLSIWNSLDTDIASESKSFKTNTLVRYPDPGDFRYQLIAHTNEGCPTDTLWQRIHVSTPIEDVTRDTVACLGAPLLLSVEVTTPGAQYAWSSSADCADLIGTGEKLNVTPTNDTTYYVKVKNEKCEKVLEQKVSVFTTPEIQLNGDNIVCSDAAVNLHGEISSLTGISELVLRESVDGTFVGDTSLWNSFMGENLDIKNIQILRFPKKETEYSLVAIPFYCPAAQVSHNVKVIDSKQDYLFTTSADYVCPGDPVTLTSVFTSTPKRIQITQSDPDIVENSFNEIILDSCCSTIVYPKSKALYTLVPIYEGECMGEKHSLLVNIKEPPKGSTKDTTICEGQSAFLEVITPQEGLTFIWSHFADITDTIGVGNKVNITPTEDATYYVKFGEGRCENIMEQTVHVVSSPNLELTGNDLICPGTELTLHHNVSSLEDLTKVLLRIFEDGKLINESEIWNASMAESDKLNGDSYDYPKQESEYSLVALSNHCPESSVSHSVKLIDVPTNFSFTVSTDSICLGDSVLLSTDFPFSQGNLKLDVWHSTDTDRPSDSQIMESNSLYDYPNDNIRYDLIARTEEGCPADTLSLSVHVTKPLECLITDTTVCENDPVFLHICDSESDVQYIWSQSEDFSDTISIGNRVKITPTEDTDYFVKVVNGKCVDTFQQTVHVVPHPSIELEMDGCSLVCSGVGGIGDYLYDLGSGFSKNNRLDFVIPSARYTFLIKDEIGCIGDTTFIAKHEEIIIPEFFTPNGDGLHDTWTIVNLDKYQQVKISIFDRFGKKLTESSDPNFSWDGTYNGNPLSSEDYWYTIHIRDIDRSFTGHFTLIRSK